MSQNNEDRSPRRLTRSEYFLHKFEVFEPIVGAAEILHQTHSDITHLHLSEAERASKFIISSLAGVAISGGAAALTTAVFYNKDKEIDTYKKEKKSKVIGAGLALAGLAGIGYLGYKGKLSGLKNIFPGKPRPPSGPGTILPPTPKGPPPRATAKVPTTIVGVSANKLKLLPASTSIAKEVMKAGETSARAGTGTRTILSKGARILKSL